MSFQEFSPVYDVEVVGFYVLHHCTSSGTDEFFKDQSTSQEVSFNKFNNSLQVGTD